MPQSGPSETVRFWWISTSRRHWLLCVLATAWLAGLGTQWFRIARDLAGAHRVLGRSAETAYVPPVAALRVASLGHQSFLADLLFLRAAHYFIDHLITDSQLPWLDLYLTAIWGLDAHNASTYRWGSQVIKFGQRIDDEVSHRANRYARMGLATFPDDPWLAHEVAFNLRYGLSTRSPEEKQQRRALALRYLDLAYASSNFNFDPNYLANQYLRAGRAEDSVQAALATYSAGTAGERRNLRKLLIDRDKQTYAQELAWMEVMRARDWKYLDDTMAWFVGPKRIPAPPLNAADLDAWAREAETPAAVTEGLGVTRWRAPGGLGLPSDPTPQ
ncbi:MAG: hypothetical protein EXR79_07950 [Myxococcales bacterium]|nr:hypothetical protein [Myxococcales bacterium]